MAVQHAQSNPNHTYKTLEEMPITCHRVIKSSSEKVSLRSSNQMKRSFMGRPPVTGLNQYSAQIIEGDSSSGEYGDTVSSDNEEELPAMTPTRAKSQEFTIDLAPMFATHSITQGLPASVSRFNLPISEDDSVFEKFNSQETTPRPLFLERIQGIVVNVAHSAQFPKMSSGCRSIVAWSDARTAYASEYQSTIETYIKTSYSAIRQHLTFHFSIAPNADRLCNMASLRKRITAGGILFHYIGYGFPNITSENMWCSERRSRDFMPFKLGDLFLRLQPPTWYIFDCSNAAVAIEAFERASSLPDRDRSFNPKDWVCICASDVGEELPQDPRLPCDFLTSCILSPVKIAMICHILQHYRTLATGKFPLELPRANMWWESRDAGRLGITLAAIADAIAADGMDPGMYSRMFRMDRLSAVLFRNTLLAQFLLRPYRVHPVCHPAIPDMSLHCLWRQWSVILDTFICSVSVPRPVFTSELFRSVARSFETILESNKLELVRAYHLTLLFHMSVSEGDQKALYLLAEYSSKPKCNYEVLAASTVFRLLFSQMINARGNEGLFHSLCYLVLVLFHHSPRFALEVRNTDSGVNELPSLVLNQSLPVSTRLLVSAVLATLVISDDALHQVCRSRDFLVTVRKELETTKNSLQAMWLLLIIRRTFHLCSPDPSLFVGTAIHLECAQYIRHPSPACRAAAVGALASLLQPFESDVNGQLLLMAVPVAMDASYLVRFHLLLLLKRFLVSFDEHENGLASTMFPVDSYRSMMSAIFQCQEFDPDRMFEQIDEVVSTPNFMNHAHSVALFLLTYYRNDPYPSIATIAGKLISVLQKTETPTRRRVAQTNEDELILSNIDQNECLHRIALRNLLQTQSWKLEPEKDDVDEESPRGVNSLPPATFAPRARLTVREIRRHRFDPIVKVAFHQDSLGVAFATVSSLVYIDDRQVMWSIPCRDVCDIQVAEWGKQVHVCASTHSGSIFVWVVGSKTMSTAFRVSAGRVVFVVHQTVPYTIMTADYTNRIYRWDLRQERIVSEWETGAHTETTALCAHPTIPDLYVVGYMNGLIKELGLGDPHRCEFRDATALQAKKSVKRVAISKRTVPETYAVYEDGMVYFYEDKMIANQPIANQHEMKLRDFAMHQVYPLFVFTADNCIPFMSDTQGKILHVFKGVDPHCSCAMHPILPVVALGTSTGDLLLYHVSDSFP